MIHCGDPKRVQLTEEHQCAYYTHDNQLPDISLFKCYSVSAVHSFSQA